MSDLFSTLPLGATVLDNRIVVSPMCQYSAPGGCAGDWHTMHIGQFAIANPGLIILEGTAVEPPGRISAYDLCLYNDAQEHALANLVKFVRSVSNSKIGIQLFHAGRKGSQGRPADGGHTLDLEAGGWQLVAPSAVRYNDDYPIPSEARHSDIQRIVDAFANAARRAARAGFDIVELHYAHGYYLHSWLSPITNRRCDEYGGTETNRMRHPLEVYETVRGALPGHVTLGARISGTDHSTENDAWDIENALRFGQALKDRGCAFLDVSSGYLSPLQHIESMGPGFQVSLAEQVRKAVGLPTFAVGSITGAHQAEQIIRDGQADAVALGRAALYDPRWPWHAAQVLGKTPVFPPQYQRVFGLGYPAMFDITS